jgi:tetratricopeptide (TPR) repeat protein
LEDPRFAKDERERRLHQEFQEVFRSQWETRARFDSNRPEEPGITILARPRSFEMDRESHRELFVELGGDELTAVRDSSRAFTDWLVRGGTMLRSVGELAGADGYLRAAESRDDRRADVHFQLALVSILVEHWDAAKGSLLRALAVDEKLGDAHYNLGMVFEREGDVPGAEASYRAAILFSDDPLNAHARLGALLAREGDVEGALEELRTIRDIDPNSEAFRHLSAILTDT